MASTINAQTTPFAAVVTTADDTGNLAFQTANVTALTINSSQVVSLAQPLPVASGGTGASNLSSITNSVLPSQSGNNGKYLTTDGANASWGTVTSNPGTVTSVNLTAGTAISVSGGPITSSGSITVTNTGVTSVSAGTGISVSAGTGAVTITNSSPNVITTTSGGAPYYGARAWVCFNGQNGSLRNSRNISSIGVSGSIYNVNFSTAMPTSDYCAVYVEGNYNDFSDNWDRIPFNNYPTTGYFKYRFSGAQRTSCMVAVFA